jgi:hypothetical protein
MKFITYGENTIIKAEVVDCIDLYFNKDGTYFYIDLLLHGAIKQIEYKNTNAAFFKVSDGKNFRTPHGVVCCNVEGNRALFISIIFGKLIMFLECEDKTILDINDVIRELVDDEENKGVLLDD